MPGLTVHSMIRNEPFIYYSIKSVYKYVDKILLYDTGSDDPITLDGIRRLLDEDTEKKINFESIPLEDMTCTPEPRTQKVSKAIAKVRQRQINDTRTEFLLVVDGDEVHYEAGIRQIVENVIPNWPLGKVGCYLPIIWLRSLSEYVRYPHCPTSAQGRLYKREAVKMGGSYPNEFFYLRGTKKPIQRHHGVAFTPEIPQFAHFSMYLHPQNWEHIVRGKTPFQSSLPEVMLEDDIFIKRLKGKRENNETS